MRHRRLRASAYVHPPRRQRPMAGHTARQARIPARGKTTNNAYLPHHAEMRNCHAGDIPWTIEAMRDEKRVMHTAKQAVSPGTSSWIWPDTAFSDTPDSSQTISSSLHAWIRWRCVPIRILSSLAARALPCSLGGNGTCLVHGHACLVVVDAAHHGIHLAPAHAPRAQRT